LKKPLLFKEGLGWLLKSRLKVIMGKIHNNRNQKLRRKNLRNNMTKAEIILWSKLKGKQLGYKFRRQHGIGKYIVDFYCPELKLIIEVDGDTHGFYNQIVKDKERQIFLENLGFAIYRYTNNDIINNLDGVLDDLIEKIKLNPLSSTTPVPSLIRRGTILPCS